MKVCKKKTYKESFTWWKLGAGFTCMKWICLRNMCVCENIVMSEFEL